MEITSKYDQQPTIVLSEVKAGQCVRLGGHGGIYMRTQTGYLSQAPEWVRLNDGEMFYTDSLAGNGQVYLLVDIDGGWYMTKRVVPFDNLKSRGLRNESNN